MSNNIFDCLRNKGGIYNESASAIGKMAEEEGLMDKELDALDNDDEDEDIELGDALEKSIKEIDVDEIDDADIEDASNEFTVDAGEIEASRPEVFDLSLEEEFDITLSEDEDIDNLLDQLSEACSGKKTKKEGGDPQAVNVDGFEDPEGNTQCVDGPIDSQGKTSLDEGKVSDFVNNQAKKNATRYSKQNKLKQAVVKHKNKSAELKDAKAEYKDKKNKALEKFGDADMKATNDIGDSVDRKNKDVKAAKERHKQRKADIKASYKNEDAILDELEEGLDVQEVSVDGFEDGNQNAQSNDEPIADSQDGKTRLDEELDWDNILEEANEVLGESDDLEDLYDSIEGEEDDYEDDDDEYEDLDESVKSAVQKFNRRRKDIKASKDKMQAEKANASKRAIEREKQINSDYDKADAEYKDTVGKAKSEYKAKKQEIKAKYKEDEEIELEDLSLDDQLLESLILECADIIDLDEEESLNEDAQAFEDIFGDEL